MIHQKQQIVLNSLNNSTLQPKFILKHFFYFHRQLQILTQLTYFPNQILLHNNKLSIHLQFNSNIKFSLINTNKLLNHSSQLNYNHKFCGIKFQSQIESRYFQIFTNDQSQLLLWKNKLSKVINQKGFSYLYKVIKKIAKGSHSTIYYARRIQDDKQAAIKAFSKEYIISQINGWQILQNEIKIMRQLNHQNIINLYQILETQNSIYVSVQYLSGGELNQNINKKITYKHIKTITIQLLKALQYLAQKTIIHRDIKPQNILFRRLNSLDLVLADFALSTMVKDPNQIFVRCGTPGFIAPQILTSAYNQNQNTISDMFSLGCTLHMLIFNQALFQGNDQNQILEKNRICEINFQKEKYKAIDIKLMNLLKQMLQINPNKRISASNALKHQFFKSDQNYDLQILLQSTKIKPYYEHTLNKNKYIKIFDSFGVFTIVKNKIRKMSFQNQSNKSQTNSRSSFTSDSIRFSEKLIRPKQSKFTYLQNEKKQDNKVISEKKRKASQFVGRKLNFFDECN